MVDQPKFQEIAIIAGIFTILGFSHLILRVYNTKKTEHLTFTWIFFILSAQTLLALYGILNNAYGVYIPALIMMTGIIYILYVKVNYESNNKIEYELKSKNII